MLTLDVDHLAGDAGCLRCVGDENFLGVLPHAYFVLDWRVFQHLRLGREHMKRQQDRQRGDFGADPRCVKAMPCRAAFQYPGDRRSPQLAD